MVESGFTRLLFLDFDGVLHPAGGEPGQVLPFCWVSELAEELASHLDVGLVIHSSWIDVHTVEAMREFLGPLGPRLIGKVGPGEKSPAVLSFVRERPDLPWLVIDDDPTRFGPEFPGSVLMCDPSTGLSDPEIRRRLREWLNGSRPGPQG